MTRMLFPTTAGQGTILSAVHQLAQTKPDVPLIIVGDFNTGRNDPTFKAPARASIVPTFLSPSVATRDLSIYGVRNTGIGKNGLGCSRVNGFRIDHVFGNKTFVNRFPTFRCEIDHLPRLSKLTDHSAVILEAD
jgi:exonuclease III